MKKHMMSTGTAVILLICIIVVITVASTVASTVAAIADDEDTLAEEQDRYDNQINKGYEKEEYITRLPREKHPLAERCFVV